MEIVKRTEEYEIIKKRSGRYGVRDAQKKWLNGDEKVKILLAEKLIKAPEPKKPEPEPAPEAEPSAEASGESEDAASAESPADAPAEDAAKETPAEDG